MKQILAAAAAFAIFFASAVSARAAQQSGPAAPVGVTTPASAQAQRAEALATQQAAQQVVNVSDDDAERTRERLRQIFRQYPPSLADVLRLDPTLLSNDAYLAPYPELAAFLRQHPTVAHNPAFYVGTSRAEWNQPQYNASSRGINAAENVVEAMIVLTGVLAFMTLVGWAIKKLVDHRRWLRMSKIQTETHGKVFDRLSSNEDLLAYIQSPAGQKFLESAPLPVEAAGSIAAPVGRILFTAQVGTVVTFVGFALAFANSRMAATVPDYYQAAPFFLTASVLLIALGIGFMASSGVAYLLSRRFGLLGAPDSTHA